MIEYRDDEGIGETAYEDGVSHFRSGWSVPQKARTQWIWIEALTVTTITAASRKLER